VEKLLVYDENNAPDEFEAAQRKAQELITKYQIEEAQLSNHDAGQGIVRHRIDIPDPYVLDKVVLLNTVARRNFCKVLRGQGYALLYGYQSDIELSLALYRVLESDMINRMLYELEKAKDSTFSKVSWKKSFFSGYAVGVGERLDQAKSKQAQKSSGTDLVLRDKQQGIEKFWDELPKGSSNVRRIASYSGYDRGRSNGLRADIGQTRLGKTPELD
jgi:hypothetical protein